MKLRKRCVVPISGGRAHFIRTSVHVVFHLNKDAGHPVPIIRCVSHPISEVMRQVIRGEVRIPTIIRDRIYSLFSGVRFTFSGSIVASRSRVALSGVTSLLGDCPSGGFLVAKCASTEKDSGCGVSLSGHHTGTICDTLLGQRMPRRVLG